jgi:hypothetical protein
MKNRKKSRSVAYAFDEETEQTLAQIRESLCLGSNAEVLRVAVELLGVAAKVASANGSILIRDEQGRQKEIILV